MEWKSILERVERKTLVNMIQSLIIIAGLMVLFILIWMIGWDNQDAVSGITAYTIAGTIFLCWGIPRWTGLDLRKTEKKREALDGGTENGFGMLPWERVLLIVAVVAGGLWLLWNGAAWLIAKFVGTVQSYR